MVETNDPLTGMYQGVELYLTEIQALEDLEGMLGESIDHYKKIEPSMYHFGFVTKGKHVIAIGLQERRITSLLDSFGQLTALQELYLSYNQLTSLPEWFGQLTALQTLLLGNNQLISLPEWFGQLTALQELYLDGNQLTSLPESFGRLTTLQELYLIDNQLTSLPESFGRLTTLQELYLSYNQLTSLPKSIEQLTTLRILSLEDNQLTSLPKSFGQLTTLRILLLGNNQLTSLPESFGQLTALKKLILSNNKLTSLPDSIEQLIHLGRLNLEDNLLSELSLNQWKMVTKIDNVGIHRNIWDIRHFMLLRRLAEPNSSFDLKMGEIASRIFSESELEALSLSFQDVTTRSKLALKASHEFWLGISNTLARTLYGTLIGASLVKYSRILLEESISLYLFIVFFIFFAGLFGVTMFLAWRQEHGLNKQKNLFIIEKSKDYGDLLEFLEALDDKFLIPRQELATARYKTIQTFSVNFIITCITTAIFSIYSSKSSTGNQEFFAYLFELPPLTGELLTLVLFFGVLFTFSILTLVWTRLQQGRNIEKIKTAYSKDRENHEKFLKQLLKKEEGISMKLQNKDK